MLNYGIYYIEFNASMYHNTTGVPEQIPETESSISGYFNITKCPLVADIAGGTGRAVGHDGMFNKLLSCVLFLLNLFIF